MTIGTRLYTLFFGHYVGKDDQGNKYYSKKRSDLRDKRWVIYKGEAEASKVPALWNAWLHHTINEFPSSDIQYHQWQEEHQSNLTGTAEAYRPDGHFLNNDKRPTVTGDYQAWSPGAEGGE